jgi:hypothetical protein
MYELLLDGSRRQVQPWARLWAAGHGEVWRRDAEYAAQHQQVLLTELLDRS